MVRHYIEHTCGAPTFDIPTDDCVGWPNTIVGAEPRIQTYHLYIYLTYFLFIRAWKEYDINLIDYSY